jgi:hypothetical protein
MIAEIMFEDLMNPIREDSEKYSELDFTCEAILTHMDYLEELSEYEQELSLFEAGNQTGDIQTEDFKDFMKKAAAGIKKVALSILAFLMKAFMLIQNSDTGGS